jgi:hypothetical protein
MSTTPKLSPSGRFVIEHNGKTFDVTYQIEGDQLTVGCAGKYEKTELGDSAQSDEAVKALAHTVAKNELISE